MGGGYASFLFWSWFYFPQYTVWIIKCFKGKGSKVLSSLVHFPGLCVSSATWFLEFRLPYIQPGVFRILSIFLRFFLVRGLFCCRLAHHSWKWKLLIFSSTSSSCYFSQRADRSRIFWLVCYKYSLETFRLLSVLTFSWSNGLGMKKNTYWDKYFCQLDNALFKLCTSQNKFCMVHYPFAALSSSFKICFRWF